jgi:2-dehydropantoate 2-reductase
MKSRPRILVMGAGGIGGIVTATLADAGHDVVAVSTNPEIRRAIDQSGMRVRDSGGDRVIAARVLAAPLGGYDFAIVATQPPSVEDAARAVVPHLGEQGVVVVLQNGLCEERVAAVVGENRVIGAIVSWGASMPEPGCYEQTAAGGFSLGRLDGAIDPAADESVTTLAGLLEAIGPVTLTRNLRGARWSKLALNCAISSIGTIAGERLGPVVRVRRYRRLALEVMSGERDHRSRLGRAHR